MYFITTGLLQFFVVVPKKLTLSIVRLTCVQTSPLLLALQIPFFLFRRFFVSQEFGQFRRRYNCHAGQYPLGYPLSDISNKCIQFGRGCVELSRSNAEQQKQMSILVFGTSCRDHNDGVESHRLTPECVDDPVYYGDQHGSKDFILLVHSKQPHVNMQ